MGEREGGGDAGGGDGGEEMGDYTEGTHGHGRGPPTRPHTHTCTYRPPARTRAPRTHTQTNKQQCHKQADGQIDSLSQCVSSDSPLPLPSPPFEKDEEGMPVQIAWGATPSVKQGTLTTSKLSADNFPEAHLQGKAERIIGQIKPADNYWG